MLSSHHNELNKLRDDNKALREKADKFDAAEREKLSQEEKLNALIEEANKAKAENLRLLNRTKAAAKLTSLGLSEEEYSPIPDGFVSDREIPMSGNRRHYRQGNGENGFYPNIWTACFKSCRHFNKPLCNAV